MPGVDVVAIPIPMTGNEPVMNMYPINTLLSKPLKIKIGMDVFILGYPFGNTPPAFPVWKRGSIASEADIVRMTTVLLPRRYSLPSGNVRRTGHPSKLD